MLEDRDTEIKCNIDYYQPQIDTAKSHVSIVFYIEMVLFFVFGVSGNLVVVCVYFPKKHKRPCMMLMLIMGITDFIVCSTMIPLTVVEEHFQYQIDSEILCKAYYIVITAIFTISASLMTLISTEKYLVICHQFNGKHLSRGSAKILSAVLAFFSLALATYRSFFKSIYEKCPRITNNALNGTHEPWQTYTQNTNEAIMSVNKTITTTIDDTKEDITMETNTHSSVTNGNITEFFTKNTGLCSSSNYIFSDYTHMDILTKATAGLFALSICITLILYVRIFYYVYHKHQHMQQLTNSNRLWHRNLKAAFMFFIVVFVFFLSYTIPTLHNLKLFHIDVKHNYLKFIFFLTNVANPYIYSIMNPKFREGMSTLFKTHRYTSTTSRTTLDTTSSRIRSGINSLKTIP